MKLQVHTLKPAAGSKHRKKIVGRGNASGHGTTSCRGGKGQTARSGGTRGIQRRSFKFVMQSTPKLRGFTSMHKKGAEIYLSDLEKAFNAGDTVDIKTLKEKGLISNNAKCGKILSKGELKKKLIIVGIISSKQAAEKIKAAGGEIK
ncbi:MAG: 50S ribosomal protein L15 [bacterium]|nr:50S ribosomal protein L15 [Patescibacteria group bacterium]